MGQGAQAVITEVVSRSENEFVFLFALILVTLLLFFLPLYAMMRKDKKVYVDVVMSNTEALTGLKATLDTNNRVAAATISRIHDRIDSAVGMQAGIDGRLAGIEGALREIRGRQAGGGGPGRGGG